MSSLLQLSAGTLSGWHFTQNDKVATSRCGDGILSVRLLAMPSNSRASFQMEGHRTRGHRHSCSRWAWVCLPCLYFSSLALRTRSASGNFSTSVYHVRAIPHAFSRGRTLRSPVHSTQYLGPFRTQHPEPTCSPTQLQVHGSFFGKIAKLAKLPTTTR